MKVSLWRDIRTYSRTKNIVPLDERQINALKELYVELAKTLILAFMVFMIAYGYMEMRNVKIPYNYMTLAMSLLGCITYYYTLRFCYLNVIGMDVNFELLIIPGMCFTPFMFLHTISDMISFLHPTRFMYSILYCSFPIVFFLLYLGANRVYKNGKKEMDKEIDKGEKHFRPRRQISNYMIIIIIIACVFPIPYAAFFRICMFCGWGFVFYTIYHYGFTTPQNDYILGEDGLTYHKALWGKKGGFIAYDDIIDVMVQDTFNIGYSKDKIHITCRDGKHIYLYPENSFNFYKELKDII